MSERNADHGDRSEVAGGLIGRLRAAHLALTIACAGLIAVTWRADQSWAVYPGIVLVAGAGLMVAGRAGRPGVTRAGRAIWVLLGLGLVLYPFSAFLLVVTQFDPDFRSIWSYLAALAGYACEVIALVLLLRADAPVYRATAVLDSLVVVLGVAGVAVAAFGPVLGSSSVGFVTALVLLAYPTGDLVVLCVALGGLAVLGWPWRSHWGLLAAGFATFTAFDTFFLVSATTGDFTGGLLVDTLWPFGAVLLIAGAWRQAPLSRPPGERARLWALPLAFVLISLAILVSDEAGVEVPTAATGLSCAAIVAAFVRMSLTFREVSELVETRRQAHHDDLTELPNRRQLYGRLEHCLAGRAEGEHLSLLLLDLNRFKEVNDALGHGIGDELLCPYPERWAVGSP